MAVEFENLDNKTKIIFLTCVVILTYLITFSILRRLAPPRTAYEYIMGFEISSQGYAFLHIISTLIAICVTFFASVHLGKVKVPTVAEIIRKEKVRKIRKKKKR